MAKEVVPLYAISYSSIGLPRGEERGKREWSTPTPKFFTVMISHYYAAASAYLYYFLLP